MLTSDHAADAVGPPFQPISVDDLTLPVGTPVRLDLTLRVSAANANLFKHM